MGGVNAALDASGTISGRVTSPGGRYRAASTQARATVVTARAGTVSAGIDAALTR